MNNAEALDELMTQERSLRDRIDALKESRGEWRRAAMSAWNDLDALYERLRALKEELRAEKAGRVNDEAIPEAHD